MCGRPVYGRPYTVLLEGHIGRGKLLCGECVEEFKQALYALLGKTEPADRLEARVKLYQDLQGRLAATEDVRAELLAWWKAEPTVFTKDEKKGIEALQEMLGGGPNKSGRLSEPNVATWKRLRGHFMPLPDSEQSAGHRGAERATAQSPAPPVELGADDWKLEPAARHAGWSIYESTPRNMAAIRRTLVEELYFDPAQFTDEEAELIRKLPADSHDFPPVTVSLYARVVYARRRVGVPAS